jgi:hypothetical protein
MVSISARSSVKGAERSVNEQAVLATIALPQLFRMNGAIQNAPVAA